MSTDKMGVCVSLLYKSLVLEVRGIIKKINYNHVKDIMLPLT